LKRNDGHSNHVNLKKVREQAMKKKDKYVRNKRDGTYSPLSDDGKILAGLVLTDLPEDGVCVGEFEYP